MSLPVLVDMLEVVVMLVVISGKLVSVLDPDIVEDDSKVSLVIVVLEPDVPTLDVLVLDQTLSLVEALLVPALIEAVLIDTKGGGDEAELGCKDVGELLDEIVPVEVGSDRPELTEMEDRATFVEEPLYERLEVEVVYEGLFNVVPPWL